MEIFPRIQNQSQIARQPGFFFPGLEVTTNFTPFVKLGSCCMKYGWFLHDLLLISI